MSSESSEYHFRELLTTYRRSLQILLQQMALHGGFANAPLHILNSVRFHRDQIQQTKADLLKLGFVDDDPLDTVQLFPSSIESRTDVQINHNLPSASSTFVMRQREFDDAVEGLGERSPVVLIAGLGGTGKTSLALELAERCLRKSDDVPQFEAAIWISDQGAPGSTTLNGVLDTIAQTLSYPAYTRLADDAKKSEINRLLRIQKVLLIIDNFETIIDGRLLDFLQRLPNPSKAIVTTREFRREFRSSWTVEMHGMNEEEARTFIDQRLRILKGDKRSFAREELEDIIAVTGGNPKALEVALGLITREHYPISVVINELREAHTDLFDDLFSRAWKLIDERAQHVLMAATFFPSSANPDALCATADSEVLSFHRTISLLNDLSLLDIQRNAPPRYALHPLVRSFVSSRLNMQPDWEQAARKRWVAWVAEFTTPFRFPMADIRSLIRLQPEEDTAYAALSWTAQQQWDADTILIAEGVDHFYYVRGEWTKKEAGDRMHIEAAHRLGNANQEAKAIAQYVQLLCRKGDLGEAKQRLMQLRDVEQSAELNADTFVQVQHAYAFYHMGCNDFETAQRILLHCQTYSPQPSPNLVVATSHWLATCVYRQSQLADTVTHRAELLSIAEERFSEALVEAKKVSYQRSTSYCQLHLGKIAFNQDDLVRAMPLLTDCLEGARQIEERRYIAQAQLALARLYLRQNDRAMAYVAFAEADKLYNSLGLRDDHDQLKAVRRELANMPVSIYGYMRVLDVGLDLDSFMWRVKTAEQRALLLDYDGTLAPFRVERDQAFPYDGVREILSAILAAGRTRLVIISGRAVNDLVPLLGINPMPELWGTHGWERLLPNGEYQGPDLPTRAMGGLEKAFEWIKQSKLQERCERKPASIALHWRGLDVTSVNTVRSAAEQGWAPLVASAGLVLKPFDGGIELSVPGKNKGIAVRTILEEMGKSAVMAYLGDDRTDEDAFEVIRGNGLSILVRSQFRPTAASVWLQPPEGLLTFLSQWQ